MDAINWWLIALAFGLGFVLTLAFTIRRVTREVPVYATSVPSGDAATLVGDVANDDDADADSAAGGEHPYGAGSVRLVGGTAAPSGWTIKGNEDSMLYHTPESPSYDQTIAELWFRDEESAESAGFARWDSGKSERGQE